MQKFNVDILKQNISTLMKNEGVKQQELADIIGMSQSNISKALSLKEKKCFTVEQIFSIADYFGVSIDWLLGFEAAQKKAEGQRAIGAFVAGLLKNGIAKHIPVTVEEKVFETVRDQHGYPESKQETRSITYPAIYFPNYWNPNECDGSEEEREIAFIEASQVGNKTPNVTLNRFINQYLDILRAYKDHQLSDNSFMTVLEEYLSRLREM